MAKYSAPRKPYVEIMALHSRAELHVRPSNFSDQMQSDGKSLLRLQQVGRFLTKKTGMVPFAGVQRNNGKGLGHADTSSQQPYLRSVHSD